MPDIDLRSEFVNRFTNRATENYAPGDVIIRRGDQPDRVGFVREGVVGMYCRGHEKFDPKATENLELMLILGRGQWFNWGAFYEGLQGTEFRALSNVTINLFNKNDVESFDGDVSRYALIDEASRFAQMVLRFGAAKTTLKWRLLVTLMSIRSCTDLPEFNLSLADLASMCRASKTNLVPLMKELEEEGLVEKGYNVYWIADREAVEAACMKLRNG